MGKIRVKTLGIEEIEKKEKKEAKKRKEAKKFTKVPGLKGGEKVVVVEPSEEELKKIEAIEKTVTTRPQTPEAPATGGQAETQKKTEAQKLGVSKKSPTSVVAKKRARSQKYQTIAKLVDRNKIYPLKEALELLPSLKLAKFDETVELHINTTEKGISGNLTLPHGTGKKTRVVIANPVKEPKEFEALLKKVESGNIDFDILIATPETMPKLARIAKFLGPRGLMPNIKNGTISKNPEDLAGKYEAGQISFKTETVFPLIHLTVGKVSFGEEKLLENIKAVFGVLPKDKIQKVVLKSTMSPGIKIDFTKS